MKQRAWHIVVALCAALVLAEFARAELNADVDTYVEAQRVEQKIPGVALLVVKDGQIVKSQGYGLANVEHQVPVTNETIFQSGSMGKQFTAAGVMLLVEDGKLALDDVVNKYLESAPQPWQAITVRHLLSHTAGLGDYPKSFDLKRDYTEDELLSAIYASKLAFEPGESWSYSNLGYVTLGILIHKVSGKFYGDFLDERIFRPLGMTATRIISESEVVPHRSAGYRLVDGKLANQEWVSPTMNSTADGSLYFNLVDLAKWDAALAGEQLLRKSSLDAMWTPIVLTSGKPSKERYGFGWSLEDVRGHRVVQHGGAWQGFTTFIIRFPNDRLSVVVLTNLSAKDSKPGKIARHVAGIYLPEVLPAETPLDVK